MSANEVEVFDVSIEKVIGKVPEAVVEAGCKGLRSCDINIRKLKFSVVDSQTGDVIKNEMWVSPNVPYWSHLLLQCQIQTVQTDTGLQSIKICNKITNFSFPVTP